MRQITIRKSVGKDVADAIPSLIDKAIDWMKKKYPNVNFDNVEFIFSARFNRSRYFRNEVANAKYVAPNVCVCTRATLMLYNEPSQPTATAPLPSSTPRRENPRLASTTIFFNPKPKKMKVTLKSGEQVELKTLVVKAGVLNYKDATVNGVKDTHGDLIPCKKGELWCPIIDIDSGVITNWKQGVKAEVYYKVCDEGSYYLQDAEGNTVLSIEQDYVPEMLCPKESDSGDYIMMDIDKDGRIANFRPTIEGFYED